MKSGTAEYLQSHARIRRRNVRLNPLDYGHAEEADLAPAKRFCTESYLPVIDQLLLSLDQRISAYNHVSDRFGFFGRLDKLNPGEIITAAAKLVETYDGDVEDCLGSELVQLADLCLEFRHEKDDAVSYEQFLYNIITDKNLTDTFPNAEIALRMYLVLMVANSSSERSFSKLKLIKNRLRTVMNQERLSNLSLLSIEFDILRELDFSDIVEEFANRRARKVNT